MSLSNTGKLICPCIFLLVICCRHVLSNGSNEELLPVSISEVYESLKNSPLIRGSITSNGNRKGILTKRRLFSNLFMDDAGHNHEERNEFGIIYDYALPKKYKFMVGDNEEVTDLAGNGQIVTEITENDECEIKYIYDMDYDSAVCRLVGGDCYLEYEKQFRTVIPDKNRCLQKNNDCVMNISDYGNNGVMLPFTRLNCLKYRMKARTLSDLPFPELEKKNECEFRYINELTPQELFCQLKDNACYLGNEEKITIIRDDENCKLVRNHCVSKGDMRTELPFVSKNCHKFDIPNNSRKRRQLTYPAKGCELYSSQNMFYRIVKCQLINGECYLEMDNRVTIQPDNENCFQHGDGCYAFTSFPRTELPLVDKDCIRRIDVIEHYPKNNRGLPQGLSSKLGSAKKEFINSSPKLAGRAGHHFMDTTDEPPSNELGLNGVSFGRSSINVPPNPLEETLFDGLSDVKVQRARWKDKSSDDDIWKDPQYTSCILVMQKKGDKFEKRCYPGNEETDYLISDESNCRLIDGQCYKVHKNRKIKKKYLSTKKELRRVKLFDECYEIDVEDLYESPCSQSNYELLMVDPENPKNFCDSKDCGETKDKTVVPVRTVNRDSDSVLMDALKAMVPEDQLNMKPDGLFYSVAFLYNDSFSGALSTPIVQKKESNRYENKNDQYFKNEENIGYLDLDDYLYDDSDASGEISEGKSRQSARSEDAWQDLKNTNCIFHMIKGKHSWKAKCYPGNDLSDEINPQLENSCRLIDGECLKVHRDQQFLSSYFRESPNEILKCIKLDDECFLVSANLLLENKDDCYESMCNNLIEDPQFLGNYCESSDCGHSGNNLKFLRELNDGEVSSDRPKVKSLKDLPVSYPLLQALKAVVPKTNLNENPSALLFSIGLLYNSSRSSDVPIEELAGRSNQKVMQKVGNITVEVRKRDETPEYLSTEHRNLTDILNTQEADISLDKDQRLAKNAQILNEYQSVSSDEHDSGFDAIVKRRRFFRNQGTEKEKQISVHDADQSKRELRNGENSEYFFTYQPIAVETQPENLPRERSEFYFNPSIPFIFLGDYPGTKEGTNDTIIINEKPYKYHDENIPTVQEIRTKTVHISDDLLPNEYNKDAIIDFLSAYPLPYWCTPEENGNVINNCCEKHEKCKDAIEPSEEKYGLENTSVYKRYHCSCEYDFFKCLKSIEGIVANSLGVAYFNVIAPKCFAPLSRLKCLSRNKWKKCVKYGNDETSKEAYRWLDTPTF
ncbi:uncharacterized protein LOC123685107 isoform X2 [Harmonia axyridis]|nr:uncharacterized protein LOC123685107 isoform X2 [Harmonia axyridis]